MALLRSREGWLLTSLLYFACTWVPLLDCVPVSRPLLRHDLIECLHHLGLRSRTSTFIENFHASTMLLHKQLLHVYLLTAYVCILKEVNLQPI